MNPLLFPPTLIKRVLDDLSAIADGIRWLPRIHAELLAMRDGVDALRAEMAPIGQLPAVREAVEPLPDGIDGLQARLDALRDQMAPIAELHKVREGIEPLDDDMRSVRESVDHLEPLIEQVNVRLASVDERIETLRGDLSPLGELADKVPGIGR